jgi:hypothetical protein
MRSTERSSSPLVIASRRADVWAFWFIATIGVAVIAFAAASIAAFEAPWLWAFTAAVSVCAPGIVWRRWYAVGVAGWNRCVSLAARALRGYALRLSYYLLFTAVGRCGNSVEVIRRNAGDSRWIARAAVIEQGRWVFFLMPVIWLLRLLPDERQHSAPLRSTYTLY